MIALLFSIALSTPRWIVPDALPPGTTVAASNNNVAIASHDGRLFMAWRTAPSHFASSKTRLLVAASRDEGTSWSLENDIQVGADLREPHFLELGGRFFLYYVELGTSALGFEPRHVWRIERSSSGWSQAVRAGEDGEIPWDIQARGGRAWKTSYRGGHYDLFGPARVELRFQSSADGLNWEPGGPEAVVYTGGLSEAAFAFDREGTLWSVARNEDGDTSGWGSMLASAKVESRKWEFPAASDPERYDSPRMFEHEGEIYLVARRDVGGPFDGGRRWLPAVLQRLSYMAGYWIRPKRTALYRIDREKRRVEFLQDLPSGGDTAFPSIVRLAPHRFLIANYSSPLDRPDSSWVRGQLSSRGTGLYLIELRFKK